MCDRVRSPRCGVRACRVSKERRPKRAPACIGIQTNEAADVLVRSKAEIGLVELCLLLRLEVGEQWIVRIEMLRRLIHGLILNDQVYTHHEGKGLLVGFVGYRLTVQL